MKILITIGVGLCQTIKLTNKLKEDNIYVHKYKNISRDKVYKGSVECVKYLSAFDSDSIKFHTIFQFTN